MPDGGTNACMAACPLGEPPTCATAIEMTKTCGKTCTPAERENLLLLAKDQPCEIPVLVGSPVYNG